MSRTTKKLFLYTAVMALALGSGYAFGKPPEGKGPPEGKSNDKSVTHGQLHDDHGKSKAKAGFHFEDRQRSLIRDYFGKEFSRGNCPPGLAKKHNGCMPPGQAKKWAIGHRLPPDVVYYDLPYALLRELGRAPDGHKYVRVAADVLLIAVGTGMVVDALEDLSGL